MIIALVKLTFHEAIGKITNLAILTFSGKKSLLFRELRQSLLTSCVYRSVGRGRFYTRGLCF